MPPVCPLYAPCIEYACIWLEDGFVRPVGATPPRHFVSIEDSGSCRDFHAGEIDFLRLPCALGFAPCLDRAAGRGFTGSASGRVWRQGPGWQRVFPGRFQGRVAVQSPFSMG
jgi:hypothetical protein